MAPAVGQWPWRTPASSWSRAQGSGVRRPGGAGGWNQQRGDGDRRSSGPTLQLQHTEGLGAPAEVDKQCDDRLRPDKQQFGLPPAPGLLSGRRVGRQHLQGGCSLPESC